MSAREPGTTVTCSRSSEQESSAAFLAPLPKTSGALFSKLLLSVGDLIGMHVELLGQSGRRQLTPYRRQGDFGFEFTRTCPSLPSCRVSPEQAADDGGGAYRRPITVQIRWVRLSVQLGHDGVLWAGCFCAVYDCRLRCLP